MMLPVRFTAADAGADQQVRVVELDGKRVVMQRQVRGIRMAVNVPVTSFLGVALRLVSEGEGIRPRLLLSLEHRDPALCIPLAHLPGDEAIAEWQLWGRVCGLPLLVCDRDGRLHEPFPRLGAVSLGESPDRRRRRRNAISKRRPSLPLWRRRGLATIPAAVHRGEREIIARD